MKTKFVLNGKKVSVEISPMTRLLDVVRNEFGLTGSKEGCGEGECGACSVLINGKVVNSCLIPVCQVEGDKVQTIEGFAKNRKLSILQKAFVEKG